MRAVGFQQGVLAGHEHVALGGGHGESDGQFKGSPHGKHQGTCELCEAGAMHVDFVATDFQIGEAKAAFMIGEGGGGEVGVRLAHDDLGVLHHGAAGIGDAAADTCGVDGFLRGRD